MSISKITSTMSGIQSEYRNFSGGLSREGKQLYTRYYNIPCNQVGKNNYIVFHLHSTYFIHNFKQLITNGM